MKETLVFVAPLWTPELEELLIVTKESFQIKVLTEKQALEFNDPYIEILQCFETYSPLELAKLLPWFMQLQTPRFHLVLPPHATPRQLAGVGSIASIAKAIPRSSMSHSPWPEGHWSFPIWLKAFQNLFEGTPITLGRRTLTLPKGGALNDSPPYLGLKIIRHRWVFPSLAGLESNWQGLIGCLLGQKQNLLEFWYWEQLPVRQQHKIRRQFAEVWEQFHAQAPRMQLEEWREVQFLVLVGDIQIQFSETDLLDLALIHGVNIVMDTSMRQRLCGPWKDGDNFWLWRDNQWDNPHRPWNDPYLLLPFGSKAQLKGFYDQMTNQVLRSFNRLDFHRQEY